MKRFDNWIAKCDALLLVIVIAIGVSFAILAGNDTTLKGFYTIFYLPLIMYIIKQMIDSKNENKKFAIDVSLSTNDADNETVVWEETNQSSNEYTNIIVENKGTIPFYQMYVKIKLNDMNEKYYRIIYTVLSQDDCRLRIPYSADEIKEILITCSLSPDHFTIRYYGTQSGKNKIIMSKIEYLKEKDAICYSEKNIEYVKMDRFIVNAEWNNHDG